MYKQVERGGLQVRRYTIHYHTVHSERYIYIERGIYREVERERERGRES
jgi:hypothetical protein